MSYQISDPVMSGTLDVGEGHVISWTVSGTPTGKPAVVLHGGPGSGSAPWWRQFFDPQQYCIVQFDQRMCGRSTPSAADPDADLSTNTTDRLIADIEVLREHLGVEAWLVFGGSWGSTLGLAYAVEHPNRVSELVLWAVVTTRQFEVEWLSTGMGLLFPQEFDELLSHLPEGDREGNIPRAVNRLLMSPDPEVHNPVSRAWARWEDRTATLSGPVRESSRMEDDGFRLGFTRLVTHFFGNYAFLEDDFIVGRLGRLAAVPVVLVRGRLDISSPLRAAWEVASGLPHAEFHIIEDAGHGCGAEGDAVLVSALDRFARQPRNGT